MNITPQILSTGQSDKCEGTGWTMDEKDVETLVDGYWYTVAGHSAVTFYV